jgi:hypothetical protein
LIGLNHTSLRNAYMTINPIKHQGIFRQDLLDAEPAVEETDYFRHIRFRRPLDVHIDGKSGRGVIVIPQADTAVKDMSEAVEAAGTGREEALAFADDIETDPDYGPGE